MFLSEFSRILIFSRSDWVSDCNRNGIADAVDIDEGRSRDCNGNAIPDRCDIERAQSSDCDHNRIPDECETSTRASP